MFFLSSYWLIARKEFRDIFRDRKSLIGALVVPIVIMPLMTFMMSSQMSQPRTPYSLFLNSEKLMPWTDRIDGDLNVKAQVLNEPYEAFTKTVQGTSRAAGLFHSEPTSPDQTGTIRVLFPKGLSAKEELELTKFANLVANSLFAKSGHAGSGAANPEHSKIDYISFEPSSQDSNLVGKVILMLLAIFTFYGMMGAINFGGDLSVGEKERETLLDLLITPQKHRTILLAKLSALLSVSVLSLLSGVLGFALAIASAYAANDFANLSEAELYQSQVFIETFRAEHLWISLAYYLPVILLLAGLVLLVGFIAKSSKEYKVLCFPLTVMFVGLFAAGQYMTVDYAEWVPILNVADGVRMLTSGRFSWLHFAISTVTNIGTFAYVIVIMENLLNSEKCLRRG